MDTAQIARLQATAGNQAVHRLLRAGRAVRALQRVKVGSALAGDKAYARARIDPLVDVYFVGQKLTKGLEVGGDACMQMIEVGKRLAQAEFEKEDARGLPHTKRRRRFRRASTQKQLRRSAWSS